MKQGKQINTCVKKCEKKIGADKPRGLKIAHKKACYGPKRK